MPDKYWTGWIRNPDLRDVASYVEKNLDGVSQDRIVSVTHSSALDGRGTAMFSAMIVLRVEDRQKPAPS